MKINDQVKITDVESDYFGSWGVIVRIDGDEYHVAIAHGIDSIPIFSKGQIKKIKGGK